MDIMDLSEKINNCKDCIYRSWAFKNLSDEELLLLNSKKTEKYFRKGENICLEGDPVASFLYLQTGLVKLYKTESNNREHIISIASQKDFIGLLSIFSNKVQVYSITAIEDSIVCLVDLDIIKKLIKTNGEEIKEYTGYPIGGIPPFGHDSPMIIFIDEDLKRFDAIFCAGGTPNTIFQINPIQIAEITHGKWLKIH